MPQLLRPVGLGLASRGDVRQTAEWARRVETAGLESLWIHDSYFERDPITFLATAAYATRDLKLAAAALNPLTRHPFVVASTLASLDDLAPDRFTLALGSGLPLRLAQMNLPVEDAPAKVSAAIDEIRTLWRGERLVLNPAVPPLVPMFAPPHRIPIYIAAYTNRYLDIAGQKADGYLARPMESLPAFELMRERVLRSAAAHQREPSSLDFRGYLLCLIEDSRAAALNRAKREPFVIYMVSILSDISMKRAGFPPELRDRVNQLWRAEDYHSAAQMIPDELLDAFLLVGTAEDVAERAQAYHQAGMDVPLLQPIVQEERHVEAAIKASVIYGNLGSAGAFNPTRRVAEQRRAGTVSKLRRRAGAYYEIARPFSFTASVLPVLAGGALAWAQHRFAGWLWLAALVAGVALHVGTNVINEIFDVRHGIDSITSPRASLALVKGRLTERQAFLLAYSAFALCAALGLILVWQRGPWMLALGVVGLLGGYFYTAPPFQYKYRALGIPLVFVLMGPLMVAGGYFAASGRFDWQILPVSLPLALLVVAILHGNEWRDVSEDTRLGFTTLSAELGKRVAYRLYMALVVGAYIALALAVLTGILPRLTLLAILSLPVAVAVLSMAERGAGGSLRAIAMIDLMTARLHASFGVLMVAGLVGTRFLAGTA